MRTVENNGIAEDERQQGTPKPYPSWTELMSRLRRDSPNAQPAATAAPGTRDWHALVADMIVGR